MWAIRILNGPQAGQSYNLKEGKNKIGRAPHCDYQINVAGVSKEHLEIQLMGDKIFITDLNSSNGTFLNGVRIKGSQLKIGDKVGAHNILFDLVSAAGIAAKSVPKNIPQHMPQQMSQPRPMNPQMPAVPQAMYQQMPQQPMQMEQKPAAAHKTFSEKFQDYMDRVVLSSLYSMSENVEFKFLVMGIVGMYVILVTILSVIPMKVITSESISYESRRRALTVARALAQSNERVLKNGDVTSYRADLVMREEGVEDVYIISKELTIVAPPERNGQAPKESAFLKKLRGQTKDYSEEFNDRFVAAVPILSYDAELQQNVARAYSIVIYNPGHLKFDDGRAFSLFVQMLAIAFILGGVLFYFLYKLIEYPYFRLNHEIDNALRERKDSMHIPVNLPIFQKSMINLNSMLVRALSASEEMDETPSFNRATENINLISMFGYPALLIGKDGTIQKGNAAFEALTGAQLDQIENRKLDAIPDQAMQKNIQELLTTANANPAQVAIDKLDISSHMFKLSCQALSTPSGEIDQFILVVSPLDGSEGQAA